MVVKEKDLLEVLSEPTFEITLEEAIFKYQTKNQLRICFLENFLIFSM